MNTDCDDESNTVFPGATEIVADGIDQDCDVDNGDVCYSDNDGDGFGTSTTVASANLSCADDGESTSDQDCDDNEAQSFPGNTEDCDGIDNDCDGQIDESGTSNTYYTDSDGDGDGDINGATTTGCNEPAGFASTNTDCDDSDDTIFGGASELALTAQIRLRWHRFFGTSTALSPTTLHSRVRLRVIEWVRPELSWKCYRRQRNNGFRWNSSDKSSYIIDGSASCTGRRQQASLCLARALRSLATP